VDRGPGIDVVGRMAEAVRERDMKFVATFHHGFLYYRGWWTDDIDEDKYDIVEPEYRELYWPKTKVPEEEFLPYWEGTIREVVDEYRPDLLWFDFCFGRAPAERRQSVVCHYYNSARRWDKDVVLTRKGDQLPPGVAVKDYERGRTDSLTERTWLTDTSLNRNSWGHVQNPDYKSADTVVDTLVDIVSKNGALLLNVGPKADGTIPLAARRRLLKVGRWLDLNGEGIYGTRPWTTFGEGPTRIKGGRMSERKKQVSYTAKDVRFTRRGSVLYAICMAWPDESVAIDSLGTESVHCDGKIESVRLIGHNGKLEWTQYEDTLTVRMPPQKPCEYAFVLKIRFAER
jgi:alpha-L-fucosidase